MTKQMTLEQQVSQLQAQIEFSDGKSNENYT